MKGYLSAALVESDFTIPRNLRCIRRRYRATSNGKWSGIVGSKCRGRTECKLLEALVGMDGEEGYKVAVMSK